MNEDKGDNNVGSNATLIASRGAMDNIDWCNG